MRSGEIISFDDIKAGYGRSRILKGLSFSVREGEVFGVIGPNGCGKSTMLNVLTGTLCPSSGRLFYREKEISGLPSYKRCRLGIGRTWQIPRPFKGMTVYDNVLTGAVHGAGESVKQSREKAEKVLKETGLADKSRIPSGELTLLDRKRLELARAMASGPEVLLLDEVAAGLTEAETKEIMALVGGLRERKYTVIWIEHNIETMLKATDRLMCMADGRNVICGDPGEVMGSEIVEELYLGKD